ncbi:hypothetical protein G7046_g6325 [Stylonectria norvegica]|nr:hypothetical protein G7046_g6325 [Stylonectria norvegica]
MEFRVQRGVAFRASVAYIMLRPLFTTGEYDDGLPIFPGSTPGRTQFFPTAENHPHLEIDRTLIGIPPVRPGDYIFWHCDLVHGVDPTQPGENDSSVFYNACNPLTPYNADSLVQTREAFLNGDTPVDFMRFTAGDEKEYQHEDCGASKENVISSDELKALGLERFDEDEDGLTAGQIAVRRSIIYDSASESPVQHIINMGQGFFGYNSLEFIIKAAQEAVTRVDRNQYSPSNSRSRLKRSIAAAYSKSLGWDINHEDEVTIITGANEGILSAFMAFIQDGDEAIVFEPFFDQYISNIEMAGGVVRYVPLSPPVTDDVCTASASEWALDLGKLKAIFTLRTRIVVVNTPHNPIGKIFSKDELSAIAELCVKQGAIILADEVYDSLCYAPAVHGASLSPEAWNLTLTVGSAGKSIYATGWRLGFLIGPKHLIQYVSAAHMCICYTSPSPLQEGCAVSYEQAESLGFWEISRNDLKGKIERFTQVCRELGLPYTDPQGGYFVLVNFSSLRLPDSYQFPPHVASRARDFKLAWFLIMEFGLAAIPPSEFYLKENQHVAENYLRFAICKEDAVLDEAKERMERLKPYLQE